MPKDGQSTRERILDLAHELVLKQGYAATSLEQILEGAGVTKGAFFHHFKSKEELARALVDRYLAGEQQVFDATLGRAEKLTSDPLQQVLVGLGLLEEMFAALDAPHPGCLIAAFLYQNDKDWHYRKEERRWVPMNDVSAWYRVRLKDGKLEKSKFHIR